MSTIIIRRRVNMLFIRSALLCWSLGFIACSEHSNILRPIADPWVHRDPSAQLSRSEILFDQGDYAGALSAAETAFKLAPEQARIATQLGYTHLGVAGLDLFQLARRMMEKKPKAETEASPQALLLSEDNTASQMAAMADLIGLQPSDYEAITLDGNRLGTLEGAPQSGPFSPWPVLLPKSAPEARASSSSTLHHIAEAVRVLCPFIAETYKVEGDIRHFDEECTAGGYDPAEDGKALFVWAMAHLVEALAFHQVVLYQPNGDTPNLLKRSEVLQGLGQAGSMTAYVAAIKDLAATLDLIMPTSADAAAGSMLGSMFNDLETVTRTFNGMTGIPDQLAGGIVRSLEQLKAQREKLSTRPGQPSEQDKNSLVLKDQLTGGVSNKLKEQIVSRSEAGLLSETEKSDVCAAYQSISSEALSVCDGL